MFLMLWIQLKLVKSLLALWGKDLILHYLKTYVTTPFPQPQKNDFFSQV
jgi:hypothetical protein